ncbi:protein ORD [Drosophila innubila]|uniref:protein ORD n=1 Tax=Drosophila innubila TaxID=198719 RepID=UPI00148B57FA|nr:protein ORD [Drosophila innubila]
MEKKSKKTELRITKLTIQDCLGCKNVNITFPEVDNVHLLLFNLAKTSRDQVSSSSRTITPVGQALKLLCTKEYATAASLQHLPLLEIGKGCVKMSFKLKCFADIATQRESDSESDLDMNPSTSTQAQVRQQLRCERRGANRSGHDIEYNVIVIRRFDDVRFLDRVSIQIDSGNYQQFAFVDYHDTFFVQPQHKSDSLDNVNKNCVTNWLNIIQSNANFYRQLKSDGNPFENFAKLFNYPDYEQPELLEKMATKCLAAIEIVRLSERRFVLQIFEQVRQIFEFITFSEYTVWFFVPRLNMYTTLDQVNVADFDLHNVRTRIKLSSDKNIFFWHYADHNIMDILLVSFQIALAKASNQSVLFLSQLDKLAEFVTLQYIRAFFINNYYAKDATSPKWISKRYLNRIIEVSTSLGLVVFIEYPSGVTLLPENRQVIKCIQRHNECNDSITWQVFMDVTKKADSGVEHLKSIMKIN